MQKKISYIVTILIIVFAIVISAIVFFVPKNGGASCHEFDQSVFILAPSKLTIAKGDKVEDFYSVSNPSADVTFDVEKETLVKIENNDITGLKQGITNVKIIASIGEVEVTHTIIVTIEDEKRAEISSGENCYIADNVVYAKAEMFTLDIEFFDNAGNCLNCDFSCSCKDNDVNISKRFSTLIIKTSHDALISIVFDNGCTKTINVKIDF